MTVNPPHAPAGSRWPWLGRGLSALRSIRVRLTLWYVALLAVILALFGVAVYLVLARSLYAQVDDNLVLVGQQLEGTVDINNGQLRFAVSEDDGTSVTAVREQGYLVWLIDASGQFVDDQPGAAHVPVPPFRPTQNSAEQTAFATLALPEGPYRVYTVFIEDNQRAVGTLQISRSLSDVGSTLDLLRLAMVLVVPLTLVVASAGGMVVAARALAPVDQITRAAQTISAADLTQRLALQLPNDELGRLARTFDAMLTRLDEAFRREREFTANASHELRTPLTVMRGEIDVALQRARTAAEYQRTLNELGGDVERLTHLAEDLLMLARADASQLPVAREPVSALLLVETLVQQFRAIALARQVELLARADDRLFFWGDESKMLRVLTNLVENAIKYAGANKRVIVSATRSGAAVVLAVDDNGPGIALADLPHIFERFYRGQAGRSTGAGLGLAIAYALAQAQGATLAVESEPGRGTTFTITVPYAE